MRAFGHEWPECPIRARCGSNYLPEGTGDSSAAGGDIQGMAHRVQLLGAQGGDAATDESFVTRVDMVEIEDALPGASRPHNCRTTSPLRVPGPEDLVAPRQGWWP